MNVSLQEIVANQTKQFRSGITREIGYRQQMLSALEEGICLHENELYEAFAADLGKSKAETYMTEISMVLGELRYIKTHLRSWMRPKRVPGTVGTFPARSRIYREPYGVVLVLAPWNYPLLLALSPVVGALAAGNCVVLKCSKSSSHCAAVIQKIINHAFPADTCYCVDANISYDEVLDQEYQYIFFTGSPRVGKQIMETAAKRLIPVSLELGGKSPCFVTDKADIRLAARRIVWGKLLNAGQTCISIDYVLVDRHVKSELIAAIEAEIKSRYGDAEKNSNYPRIINDHHYERLMNLISEEKKLGEVIGGDGDASTRRIAPALIVGADWSHPVMEEEIFGPILPLISYHNLDDAVEEVLNRPHPLATYIFTDDKKEAKDLLRRMPFGGGCVNDTIVHISNHHMPFGGVGNSGMGGYHGYYSFRTFSHEKSVLWGSHVDVPVRYAPLDEKKWSFLKKFL
ncbi:MAG: aldehyde dehydrogenase family protein [Lachnospiraceae bacterium]|nr:aldehyde dehydrogenase family protein [Lachnospiraceae bacterium]